MVVLTGEILIDLIGQNNDQASSRSYSGLLGGSALNTASVLAKAGLPVRFIGELGHDTLGGWAMQQIAARGIQSQYIRQLPVPTPLALAELDAKGNATYTFYRLFEGHAFDPNPQALQGASWFHFGSLSSFDSRNIPGLQALLQQAQSQGVAVSFDPNLRAAPTKAYWQQLEAYLPYIQLLKCSHEDAQALFPQAAPSQLLGHLQSLGVPLVVMTLGKEGAVAALAGQVVQVAGTPVQVVDTIGAGDTFSAGLLYGLLKLGVASRAQLLSWEGEGLKRVLQAAGQLAALACTVQGASLPPAGFAHWLAHNPLVEG